MIIHSKESFSKYKIQCQRKLQYMDDYSFVPIKIISETSRESHIFQTPLLFAPYGLQVKEVGRKKSIDLSFMNKSNDDTLLQFFDNLNLIYSIIQKKYSKKYHVNEFLKDTMFNDSLRLKVNPGTLFYDQNKAPLDTISSFSYGWFLINLHGLWISDKEVWFQWYLVQAKIIEPIRFHEYLFLDEASDDPFVTKDKAKEGPKAKADDKYDKMLKMGVPKDAVDRQRCMDMNQVPLSRKVPKPPPLPSSRPGPGSGEGPGPGSGEGPGPKKITASDLRGITLKKSSLRRDTEEDPMRSEDKTMGYFDPPSLGDIQSMLKQLKPISHK